MKFIRTDIENDKEWKDFLEHNYDLFFDYFFLKYNDEFGKGIHWHNIKIKDDHKNKVISILTGCEEIKDGKKYFISCNGTSFGGFKWKEKTNINDIINTINEFLIYLRSNEFDYCVLINPPNIYNKAFNEEYEYILINHGFEVHNYSITNIIRLSNFSFEKLTNPKKRSISKSEKIINVDSLEGPVDKEIFGSFYKVLLDNRLKKNVLPTHSSDELLYLKNNLSDKIKIFYAKIRGSIAGICILFLIRKDIVLNFYLATDDEFKKERVSDLILYKSIEWAKENSFRLYDIGTSNVGKIFLPGLFDFKKKYMADGFLRKTFIIKLSE